jgi:exopolysaccharide biosynthesis polyprenyl glycosylphosphotransferase
MPTRTLLTRSAGIRAVDLFLLALALPLAYGSYEHFNVAGRWLLPIEDLGIPVVLVLVLWSLASWLARVYEPLAPARAAGEQMRVLFAMALLSTGAAALAFLSKTEISRILMALYLATAAALLLAARLASRGIARATRRYSTRRFAVVGTGGLAREIAEVADAHPEWGLELAGFILPDDVRERRSRGPLLGRLSQLGRILEQEVLDLVIFALPRERIGAMEPAILLCEEQGVDVQISLDLLRYGRARMTLADLDGLPMLAFTRTPTDTVALAAKRVFDVLASAAALLVLSPVLLAVAVAIKLDSPGPVFFRQRRVGLNGRAFDMLKFRSMHLDAEARLAGLLAKNEMSGPVFKMTNDPRVTRVGRLIRRASLDELPQFWNVLRGEMSVVGPRPPIPAEVREYKRWQRRRLSMKPGITCIWQISGRNDIDFDHWMELDLQYIDQWSLWSDLRICLLTIPAVLSARGAH